MVAIKLPNGDVMNMDGEVNGLAVAQKISAGLAKAAIAVNINSKLNIRRPNRQTKEKQSTTVIYFTVRGQLD